MQAGIFRSHLESIRVITTPTSLSTHSQPVNQCWPNQATPVKYPILLGEHTDYQEIKMNLAQVLKRKGKVCNSFQGQYIFGDTILLQAITPSAKINWVIPINLCWTIMQRNDWKGRNKIHQGLTAVMLLNEILL